jgi:hypothetical protein
MYRKSSSVWPFDATISCAFAAEKLPYATQCIAALVCSVTPYKNTATDNATPRQQPPLHSVASTQALLVWCFVISSASL